MAERLRRRAANLVGYARACSNHVIRENIFLRFQCELFFNVRVSPSDLLRPTRWRWHRALAATAIQPWVIPGVIAAEKLNFPARKGGEEAEKREKNSLGTTRNFFFPSSTVYGYCTGPEPLHYLTPNC